MATLEEAKAEATAAATRNLVDRVIDRISQAGTNVVFGEPVERDGRTIITVARARYGFGGGSGSGDPEKGVPAGDGVGGGGMADPVGFIDVGPAGAEFRPIVEGRPSPAFLAAAGFAAFLLLWGIAKVLGALRG